MKLYSFVYLQAMLRERGVRSTRPYLNMLEQSGVLPKPKNHFISRIKPTYGSNESRAYTDAELKKFARIIEKYIAQNVR